MHWNVGWLRVRERALHGPPAHRGTARLALTAAHVAAYGPAHAILSAPSTHAYRLLTGYTGRLSARAAATSA